MSQLSFSFFFIVILIFIFKIWDSRYTCWRHQLAKFLTLTWTIYTWGPPSGFSLEWDPQYQHFVLRDSCCNRSPATRPSTPAKWEINNDQNNQIEWSPPPPLQHSCWQFLQLLQGRCRVTCLWKSRHSLQAMQLTTTPPEDVTNMRAWDDLKGATTLPNSEAHFQVLPTPDVHSLIVRPNLI